MPIISTEAEHSWVKSCRELKIGVLRRSLTGVAGAVFFGADRWVYAANYQIARSQYYFE